jgi:hypothetical protein
LTHSKKRKLSSLLTEKWGDGVSDGAVPKLKKLLSLKDLALDEDHCRMLGAYSRPGLEIDFTECRIIGAAATVLAAKVMGRNEGPTKLVRCEIDGLVLADGLRGNNRLKSLAFSLSRDIEVGNRELLAIAGALQENKGLVELAELLWLI